MQLNNDDISNGNSTSVQETQRRQKLRKFQSCFVCTKVVRSKMAPHLSSHADTEVVVADALNDTNKERRSKTLEALRFMGNWKFLKKELENS